jgi:DNA-binding NtrC family response regulator
MTMFTILIHDRDRKAAEARDVQLDRQGRSILLATSIDEVMVHLAATPPDLVVAAPLPRGELLGLLEAVRNHGSAPVLAMLAADRDDEAAAFLRQGGDSFLTAPVTPEVLALTVDRLECRQQEARELAVLRFAGVRSGIPPFVGESRQARSVRAFIDAVGVEKGPVLIAGEWGSGKALAGRWIHARSARAGEPFIRYNCSGIPGMDIDAALFGTETDGPGNGPRCGIVEMARGGTVLLEEVDAMGLLQQERLAGVMKGGRYCRRDGRAKLPFDVRIIATTSRDPETLVERGELDPVLFGLLQENSLFLPPLRERREDILPLVFHFIDRYNLEFGRRIAGLSKLVERLLLEYPWPGNIREMRNVIERAVILGGADLLYLEHLPLELFAKAGPVSPASFTCRLPTAGVDIEEVEKELIRQALEVSNGNQSRAARKLNLGIDAFRYRMKKFGFLK